MKVKHPKPNKNEFKRLYMEEKLYVDKLTEHYKVSMDQIYFWVRSFGLKRNPVHPA